MEDSLNNNNMDERLSERENVDEDDSSFASAQDHQLLVSTVQGLEFESGETTLIHNGFNDSVYRADQVLPSPMDKASLLWTKAVIQENIQLRRLLVTLCEGLLQHTSHPPQPYTSLPGSEKSLIDQIRDRVLGDSVAIIEEDKFHDSSLSIETLASQYKPLSEDSIETLSQEMIQALDVLNSLCQQHQSSTIASEEVAVDYVGDSSRNNSRIDSQSQSQSETQSPSKSHSQSQSSSPIPVHTHQPSPHKKHHQFGTLQGDDEEYFHHSDEGEGDEEESPRSHGHSRSHSRQAGPRSASTDMTDWIECTEVHPPPPFDLESPVVSHILSTWTEDQTKINFLISWIKSLKFTAHETYPIGIQITSISRVLRDAFIVLVIPLMRLQSIDPLVVFTREYSIDIETPNTVTTASATSPSRHDEHQGNYIDFDDRDNHSITSSSHPSNSIAANAVNSDPFVKAHDIVFDIRVKRIVDASHLKQTMHQPCQFRDVSQAELEHPSFRVDSRDYSSLTEINSIFEEIDRKHIPTIKDEVRQLSIGSIDHHNHQRHHSSSGNSQTLLATQQHQQLMNAYHQSQSTVSTSATTGSRKKEDDEMTIPLAPQRNEVPNPPPTQIDPAPPTQSSPPAYLPTSIASWFYGTKITETVQQSSPPTKDSADQHFGSSSSTGSAPVVIASTVKSGVSNNSRLQTDFSDTMSVTSETSSNADAARSSKIAAKLDALRKKQGSGK